MREFTLSSAPSSPRDPQDAEAILQGLNPTQQEAARTTEGPVLIIAGAGSGKTRTLTHRIAYLLALGKARPYQILALTFTNKAAREMRERIVKLVGETTTRGLWMGTFHSIFARIMRAECTALGYTSDFSIYDSEDSERVIRALMKQYGIDPKQYSPRALRNRISGAKNQLISPQEYGRVIATIFEEKAAQIYGPYEEVLRRSNAMDFDDLLLKPLQLFEQEPEVLAKYQARWQYLHIDEYQDTNRVQYALTKLLAAQHKNLCVVGDDAQSIYAFRGADIRNILDFQNDYGAAKIVRLEQNYRSTKRILQLADTVIKNNDQQLEKTLWTDNREGDFVILAEAYSERDEAQKVEQRIRGLQARAGLPFKAFSVLYRTNAQSRSLEDALRRGSIPYKIVGGMTFYQRREIKDAVAYLRLIVNPHDTESLRRVINYPTRGIGDKTVQKIAEFAQTNGLSLWQALERVEDIGLSVRARNAVEKFHFLIAQYATKLQTTPADELARTLIQETGILQQLRDENTVESLARWENVQELLNAVAEFSETAGAEQATLSHFLQEISLLTDADNLDTQENAVTLMTLHASKGLEFPVIFITGLEEGLFPLAMATQDVKELEEERRLFYVGITRAQEYLFLSYARSRYRYGQYQDSLRSRFLDELDADVVRMEAGNRYQSANRFGSRQASFSQKPSTYSSGSTTFKAPSKSAPEPEGRHIEYTEEAAPLGSGELAAGMRVHHATFGRGKIIAIEGQGERARATVFFKNAGQKKLVLKFARLRRIG